MASEGFGVWDGGLVLLYLFAMVALAAWPAKQETPAGFFLANRKVSLWILALSLLVVETGILGLNSLPGLLWKSTASILFLQLAMGYLLGRILAAVWFLPTLLLGEPWTPFEILGHRFRKNVEQTAALLFLLTRVLSDGLLLFVTASGLSLLTAINPGWLILIMGLVATTLSALGGMRRVLWFQALQWVLFMGITLGLLAWLVGLLPNGLGSLSLSSLEWIRAKPTGVINPSLGFVGAWLGDSQWFPAAVLGGLFLGWAYHGTDPLVAQRYLCSSSIRSAIGSLLASGLGLLGQIFVLSFLGLVMVALQREGIWSPPAGTESHQALMEIIRSFPAPCLSGLLAVSMMAITLGLLSASSLSCASVAMANGMRHHFRMPGSPMETKVAQWSTLVFGGLQTGLAMALYGIGADQDWMKFWEPVVALVAGLILGVFLLGWRKQPPKSFAVLAGLMIAAGVVITFWLPVTWGRPMIATTWITPLGALLTLGMSLILDPTRPKKGVS